jgi:hypothetical protein
MNNADNENKPEPPRKLFSDFAVNEFPLDGIRIDNIDQIFNVEIYLLDYRIAPSKIPGAPVKDFLTLQFEYPDRPGQRFITFTGSTVLMNMAQKYHKEMPFLTTIKKFHEKGKTHFRFT